VDQAKLRADYRALLDRLRDDERVVGVVLSGSQARQGMATERSDFDVLIVTADDQVSNLAGEARREPGFDVGVTSLSAFRRHALAGSEFSWDLVAGLRTSGPVDGWRRPPPTRPRARGSSRRPVPGLGMRCLVFSGDGGPGARSVRRAS